MGDDFSVTDQEYKRQQFEKGQNKTVSLRWDGGELRKVSKIL